MTTKRPRRETTEQEPADLDLPPLLPDISSASTRNGTRTEIPAGSGGSVDFNLAAKGLTSEPQGLQTMQEHDGLLVPPRLAEYQNEDLPVITHLIRDLLGWFEPQLRDYLFHVPRVAAGGITTSERQWQLGLHAFLHRQLDEFCSSLASKGPVYEFHAQVVTGAMVLNWILWSDTASPNLPLQPDYNLTSKARVDGSDSSDERIDKQIQEPAVFVSDYLATYLGEGLWISERVHHDADGFDEEAATRSDGGSGSTGKGSTSTPQKRKATASALEQPGQKTVQDHEGLLIPPKFPGLNESRTPTAQLTRDLVAWLVGQLRHNQAPQRPATGGSTSSDRRWQIGHHAFLHRQLEERCSSLASAGTDSRGKSLAVIGAMALNWILWFELVYGNLPQLDD